MSLASMSVGPLLVTILRLVLAGLLLVAAFAKARDLAGARSAAVALGVPERFGRAAAVGLVIAEICIGVGLLVNAFAPAAAAAALALLLVFTGLVAVSLRAGRRPACNCFGAGSSEPIGARTLVRNGVLIVISLVLVATAVRGGRTAIGGLDRLSVAQALVIVAVAVGSLAIVVHSWFIVQLMRQNGSLLERLDHLEGLLQAGSDGSRRQGVAEQGPTGRHRGRTAAAHHQPRRGKPIGSMAPRFGLHDVDGRAVTIDDLRGDGRPVVLLFLETSCIACTELAAEINGRGATCTDRMLVAVVNGDRREVASRFAGPGFDAVLVDPAGSLAERFEASGTPTAVLVLPDGRIASALAEGRAATARLLRHDIHTTQEAEVRRA